jgi:hypothetical protein
MLPEGYIMPISCETRSACMKETTTDNAKRRISSSPRGVVYNGSHRYGVRAR